MENIEYRKLLLNVAVCAISCDGHVDERETKALIDIEKNSPYFNAVNLAENLEDILKNSLDDIRVFIDSTMNLIKNSNLTIVQELTALEISLRIIAADKKIEQEEKDFINELRNQLKVDDDIINERFGEIEYLVPTSNSEFKKSIHSVEISEIKTVDNKDEKT